MSFAFFSNGKILLGRINITVYYYLHLYHCTVGIVYSIVEVSILYLRIIKNGDAKLIMTVEGKY